MATETKYQNLGGTVAIITGAGSGLGEAFARQISQRRRRSRGLFDINGINAKRVANEIGGTAFTVDVADSKCLDETINTVVAQHGHLDIMINNAGIAPPNDEAKIGCN